MKKIIKIIIIMYINGTCAKLEPRKRKEKIDKILRKWNIPSE